MDSCEGDLGLGLRDIGCSLLSPGLTSLTPCSIWTSNSWLDSILRLGEGGESLSCVMNSGLEETWIGMSAEPCGPVGEAGD